MGLEYNCAIILSQLQGTGKLGQSINIACGTLSSWFLYETNGMLRRRPHLPGKKRGKQLDVSAGKGACHVSLAT